MTKPILASAFSGLVFGLGLGISGMTQADKVIGFLDLTDELLEFLVPQYVEEGKTYLTIAIGCTGGRHRSVAVAEALARRLRRVKDIQLRVRHRDITES